ncbi:hypothetical protein BUALT_Bualt16G0118300 [Buddleja alternifolia]|uniref:Glycosyltransferase N-terminal domain-containing protein n=1 Tax=Buddleja alternifolia TaxID=168488 RepID=A0AAV6WK82_9LAMI|nr:hypothetical protein BUALT_Bualt16G0118300 [Buddleja alternifolia]
MDQSDQVVVLMVPFQAQGHLNQLLQLSCLISSYGLPVYYVGSAIHNRQAKTRANGLNANDVAKIHFHDIPTPPFDSPPPNPNSSNKFPEQLHPAWEAMLSLRKPIACYLQETSEKARRVIVVHDPMMALVVQDVSTIPNAESYAFNCTSAFSQVTFLWRALGKQVPTEHLKKLPSFTDGFPDKVQDLNAVERLMVSEEGDEIRKRAEELAATVRQATQEGGASRLELDSFIAHIMR